MRTFQQNLLIVGGGISGLWTLHQALANGVRASLIEADALGVGQTLASQGMIHGGQRYNLTGKESEHARNISEMPAIWSACLAGSGEIDLLSATQLAPHQCMWSPGGMGANVTAFFASKAMNSRVAPLTQGELPEIFQRAGKAFRGKVYQMDEVVLDIASVLEAMRAPLAQHIFRGEFLSIEEFEAERCIVRVRSDVESLLECNRVVFASGTGIEKAVVDIGKTDDRVTQRRPLKQILVGPIDERLYAHCLTTDPRPRVTVTTHPSPIGDVWYLGGIVAEYGLDRSDEEAILFAKKELEELFPWMEWEGKKWATYLVDRAEPYVSSGYLSFGPKLRREQSVAFAWPTKLTYAPEIARLAMEWVEGVNWTNEHDSLPLPPAVVGNYIWQGASDWKVY